MAVKKAAGKKSAGKAAAKKGTGKKTGAKKSAGKKQASDTKSKGLHIFVSSGRDFTAKESKELLEWLDQFGFTPASTGRVVKSAPFSSSLGEARIQAAVTAVVGRRTRKG